MRKIYKTFNELNKYAKYILSVGVLLIIWIFTASIAFYISAGIWGDYSTFMSISSDLAISARSCAGIISIAAFICQFTNIE